MAETATLTITSDDAAEIFVINSRFVRVGKGTQRYSGTLDIGVYKIRARIGERIHEQMIVLRKDESVHLPPLVLGSAVPMAFSAYHHEYHEGETQTASHIVHRGLGSGSFLYLCMRDYTSSLTEPSSNPARGLALFSRDGTLLLDLEHDVSVVRHNAGKDPIALINLHLDPGTYLLRLQVDERFYQLPIHTSPGWQTHVYLLQREWTRNYRAADLLNASILMSRFGNFFLNDANNRLCEQLRLSLAAGRRALPADIRNAVQQKLDNPMLGLLAAHHLLLEQPQSENERTQRNSEVRHIVELLRSLFPAPHPDVEALALEVDSPNRGYIFAVPPTFVGAWNSVVQYSIRNPLLVPAHSISARFAARVLTGTIWLIGTTHVEPVEESAPIDAESGIPVAGPPTRGGNSAIFSGTYSSVELDLFDQAVREFCDYERLTILIDGDNIQITVLLEDVDLLRKLSVFVVMPPTRTADQLRALKDYRNYP
jgi:hypothetical protein